MRTERVYWRDTATGDVLAGNRLVDAAGRVIASCHLGGPTVEPVTEADWAAGVAAARAAQVAAIASADRRNAVSAILAELELSGRRPPGPERIIPRPHIEPKPVPPARPSPRPDLPTDNRGADR